MAFDKHMNLVLGDAEEVKRTRPKGANVTKEMKRVLGK